MPSCTWTHKRCTGTSDPELRERTWDQADGPWCGQFPQQNKFVDARYQEFTCKGTGLAVADPDTAMYVGVSVQWSEGACMGNWVCHSLRMDGTSSSHWGSKVGMRAADTSYPISLHKNLPTQAAIFPVQPSTPRACLFQHHSSPCFYAPHKAWSTPAPNGYLQAIACGTVHQSIGFLAALWSSCNPICFPICLNLSAILPSVSGKCEGI